MKVFGLLLVLLALPASAQQITPKDSAHLVRESKRNIELQLKDPSSVQYRNLFISRHESGAFYLCGELNAKNSYGGYEGFRSFISSIGSMVYMGDQIHALLPEYCGNRITLGR